MQFEEPFRILNLLSNYKGRWMIAGGWAIDLYINKITRKHQDIEIAIPRTEQLQLKNYLKDWNLRYVISGKFYDWEDEYYLQSPIHEIHGKSNSDGDIEILLNEIDKDKWYFRRNLKIDYPVSLSIIASHLGIPILSPEIVLLYKAKWNEEKDKKDFVNVLPHLKYEQKQWLKRSIIFNHGTHEWIEQLS